MLSLLARNRLGIYYNMPVVSESFNSCKLDKLMFHDFNIFCALAKCVRVGAMAIYVYPTSERGKGYMTPSVLFVKFLKGQN